MAYYKLVTDKLLQCVEKTLVNIQCSIGEPGGLATLDDTGNVPLSQLGNVSGGGGGVGSLDQVLAVGNTSNHPISLGITQTFNSSLIVSGFGTSVMAGSGASSVDKCWFNLAVARMNYTENNEGVGGMALQNPSGTSIPSFLSIYTSVIPAKNSTHNYLVFAWSENDSYAQFTFPSVGYNVTDFTTNYHTILDYALGLGWTASEIIIVSAVNQAIGRVSQGIQDNYFTATQTIAANYGMLFVDFYHASQTLFPYNTFDNAVHPSDLGYEMLANTFLEAINSSLTVKTDSQLIGVNGFSEFQSIKLRSALPPTDQSQLVSLQADGTLGSYPSDTFVKLGSGSVIQYGNINVGGSGQFASDVFSSGTLWAGGGNLDLANRSGAVLGVFEGLLYLDAYESSSRIGFQIAPFGQGGSINGFLNAGTNSSGLATQLYGGTYIGTRLVLDSGSVSTGKAYEINTNGTHIYWQDSAGSPHQLDQQGGSSPAGTAGQLQYTNGTSFAATSYMTYTTNLLSLSGALGIGGSGVTTSGLSLVNTTAATSSVQQVSPALVLSGRGWSTSSSASQTGLFAIYNTPVTGSAITDTLNFASSENGGTLTPRATITSAGLFTAQNIQSNGQLIAGSSVTVGTGSFITWSGSNTPLLIDGDQNGTISQRNTAIQQAYRVYNSFSTGPNGEWVELGFKTNSNIATINTAAVGTGTVRNMTISAPEISITGGLAFKRTTVADAAYSILVTDYLVAYTSLTTARTATLPTTGVTTGQVFIVKDESGNAVTSNITVAGTIDGGTNKTIALAFGSVKVYYNGSAYFTTS